MGSAPPAADPLQLEYVDRWPGWLALNRLQHPLGDLNGPGVRIMSLGPATRAAVELSAIMGNASLMTGNAARPAGQLEHRADAGRGAKFDTALFLVERQRLVAAVAEDAQQEESAAGGNCC